MKTLLAFLFAASTCLADIVPIVQWDIETGRLEPKPYALSIRRGESVYVEPRFTSYAAPINLTGSVIQLRYWYTGQASYYATTGTLMAATGRVHIAWSDALCPASNALNYEVRATIGTNVLARGYGPLTLLAGSSGSQTNARVLTELNWSTIDQVGGPAILADSAAWLAVSNAATSGGAGTTYTFANTNLAAGVVVTNGSTVYVGTNATTATEPLWIAASNTVVYTNDARLTDNRTDAAAWHKDDTVTNAQDEALRAIALTNLPVTGPGSWTLAGGLVVSNQTAGMLTGTAYVVSVTTGAVASVTTNGQEISVVLVASGGTSGVSASDVTNSLDLAQSPSLTQTVAQAASALQAEADTLQTVTAQGGIVSNGVVTIDSANARTNTFGGALVIGGMRFQSGGGVASADGAVAIGQPGNAAIASGVGSFVFFGGTASGMSSMASGGGTASGVGSVALSGATASGINSMAFGTQAVASNDASFAWVGSHSHGDNTFNIGTPDLLYLGETNLQTYLDNAGSGISASTATNIVSGMTGSLLATNGNGSGLTGLTPAQITAAGGLTNITANITSVTLPITGGTATVSAAACWLSPGNGTNVVLLPGTWTASDQVTFGVAVSNIGYGAGYTNSLSLPTNLWRAATATNISLTSPSTVYWLIGGRGAYQPTFEVRQ